MSRIIFNKYQRRTLEVNQKVKMISNRMVQYKPEFRVQAFKENLREKGAAQFFVEKGFGLAANVNTVSTPV